MNPDPVHTAVLAVGVILPATIAVWLYLRRHDAVSDRRAHQSDLRAARLGVALREHPGHERFHRTVQAWAVMAAAGPSPMPTVAEMLELGLPLEEAVAYVAAWDPIVEWDQHRDREHLADYVEILLARAAIVEHDRQARR